MDIGGITCVELVDSFKGTIADNGSRATARFLVAWGSLLDLIKKLKGGWSLNAGNLVYVAPLTHPYWTNFYCTGIDYEGVGKATVNEDGASEWEYAIITATYEPPKIDNAGGGTTDQVEEEFDTDIDVITIPGQMMKSAGGTYTETAVKVLLPCVSYQLTMNAVPKLPGDNVSTILSVLGKLNASTFYGAAPKKMLFMGVRATRAATSVQALDQRPWKLVYKFKYRPVEWTKVYLRGAGWTEVKDPDTNKNLYETGDFMPLFPQYSPPPPAP